ncbi:MAG: hypothetical protein RL011_1116 [Pseudomonadota bacterium]|jgi:hypothetical protein
MQRSRTLSRINLLLAISLSLFATPILADSPALTSVSEAWITTSHLGFSVNDQSSTGFKMTGGTMAILDLTRPIGRNIELGLRTIASGAQAKTQEFYRLGAGPMAAWRWDSKWNIHGAITNFNETGLKPGADLSYRSTGLQYMIGWERIWQIGKRVEAVAGNFLNYHAGNVSDVASVRGLQADPRGLGSMPTKNFGISHGAEFAIRLSL